jgi:hypothetical protein
MRISGVFVNPDTCLVATFSWQGRGAQGDYFNGENACNSGLNWQHSGLISLLSCCFPSVPGAMPDINTALYEP